MKYNELSRNGLIKMAEDFDIENNNQLQEYLESKNEDTYELVNPIELIMVDHKIDSDEFIEKIAEHIPHYICKGECDCEACETEEEDTSEE